MLREAVALYLEDKPFPNAVFRLTVADPSRGCAYGAHAYAISPTLSTQVTIQCGLGTASWCAPARMSASMTTGRGQGTIPPLTGTSGPTHGTAAAGNGGSVGMITLGQCGTPPLEAYPNTAVTTPHQTISAS